MEVCIGPYRWLLYLSVMLLVVFSVKKGTDGYSFSCVYNPCQHGSQCVQVGPYHQDAKCICQPGYYGQHCEQTGCFINPCENGGTCDPVRETGFRCNCSPGSFGRYCEQTEMAEQRNNGASTQCDKTVCLNGGTCILPSISRFYRCFCPHGFYGLRCENTDPEFSDY